MTTLSPSPRGCCKITAKTETTLTGFLKGLNGLVTAVDEEYLTQAEIITLVVQYINSLALPQSGASTDNAVVRWDGTHGDAVQDSGIIVSDSDEISGYVGHLNLQTGTTYTAQASDTGKIVVCTNASPVTVTLGALQAGWCATFVQGGAGTVTFSGTVANRQSHTGTAGQHAAVCVFATATGSFILAGDTA